MKAISIRNPWAWLIVNGHKDIENRRWSSPYRGRLFIHASKTWDLDGAEDVKAAFEEAGLDWPTDFQFGGIIGVVNMVDCISKSDSPWFHGPYGFVFTEARTVPFKAVRGRLGLFSVSVQNMSKT